MSRKSWALSLGRQQREMTEVPSWKPPARGGRCSQRQGSLGQGPAINTRRLPGGREAALRGRLLLWTQPEKEVRGREHSRGRKTDGILQAEVRSSGCFLLQL